MVPQLATREVEDVKRQGYLTAHTVVVDDKRCMTYGWVFRADHTKAIRGGTFYNLEDEFGG